MRGAPNGARTDVNMGFHDAVVLAGVAQKNTKMLEGEGAAKQVYFRPRKGAAWAHGTTTADPSNKPARVRVTPDDPDEPVAEVPKDDVREYSSMAEMGVPDVGALDVLNEASILHVMLVRGGSDKYGALLAAVSGRLRLATARRSAFGPSAWLWRPPALSAPGAHRHCSDRSAVAAGAQARLPPAGTTPAWATSCWP